MKTLTLAMVLVLSASANAQPLDVKAGLWDTKVVHQIVDGEDMAPKIAASQAKMQAMMANMTPEQRAQMAPMMKSMPGRDGVMKICISPAMAAKQSAMVDPEGHCSASSVNTSGNKTTFSYTCNHDGRTSTGTGERVVNGDTATMHMDIVRADAKGTHKVVIDYVMTYLGADCQGVVPFDGMAKSAQAPHQ